MPNDAIYCTALMMRLYVYIFCLSITLATSGFAGDPISATAITPAILKSFSELAKNIRYSEVKNADDSVTFSRIVYVTQDSSLAEYLPLTDVSGKIEIAGIFCTNLGFQSAGNILAFPPRKNRFPSLYYVFTSGGKYQNIKFDRPKQIPFTSYVPVQRVASLDLGLEDQTTSPSETKYSGQHVTEKRYDEIKVEMQEWSQRQQKALSILGSVNCSH